MKWPWILGTGVMWAGLTGCGPAETVPFDDCPDPSRGEVAEECGVWVSASLGDDANAGTRASPKASLAAAVEQAAEGPKRVYACGEEWTEPLLLPNDVWLTGGFDCTHGWAWGGKDHRARLVTGPGQVPLKTAGKYGIMQISDFHIEAADAIEPGGSSIAVIITDSANLTFRRCAIIAGDGADGADAEAIEGSVPAGAAGSAGADACTADAGAGGPAPETSCAVDAISLGGKGGDGTSASAADGEAGSPAPAGEKDPANPQDGDGGKGQSGMVPCTPGEPGADGAGGEGGDTFQGIGQITPDGYIGVSGLDGKDGAPGQGGGGGGAARGGALACDVAPPGGAGGGSGGAGGCGGKGGKGGQAGGSSFAIVQIGAGSLKLTACELWVGSGGDGGDASEGQFGGPGGEPGAGGGGKGTLQSGCQGGKGGKGGRGGGGEGGSGGHAVHLALTYPIGFPKWPGNTFTGPLNGGLPGRGADGGIAGSSGAGGKGTLPDGQLVHLEFLDDP